ncbi:hypothetical protein K7472_24815 [Streptomyces sp. PTM05]|uniref:Uncharacterized protein n=1 Tax=Streptantibioticus parmotrematis TaxID=2873249 RepID=A0ABS7QXU6_9ACTN|nr:hypothetical protein [Streptantibioticus parmotrematis]MBY8888037.1 hypothetical protein [Streptantibioticus parmotrematis]
MIRLRIQRAVWPRPALILTDTPRPGCPQCDGDGGIEWPYGDYETGEYAGSEWEPCGCWNERLRWTLMPLPRLPHLPWRRLHGATDPWATGHSDEQPS